MQFWETVIFSRAKLFWRLVQARVLCACSLLRREQSRAWCFISRYRHVYGIECSAIANQAVEIIKENHLEVRIHASFHPRT